MSTLQEALNRRLESRFSVGAVIGATFMLALRRIHIFLPLAVLCYAPMVFLGYGIAWASQSIILSGGGAYIGLIRFAAEVLMDVLCASLFITLAIAQISKTSSAFNTHNARLRGTVVRIIPIYICGVLVALLSWTGFMLLLMPGLYFMIISSVALPVAITTRTGPLSPFGAATV